MYDIFRARQRRRIQTVDFVSHSHLRMLSEWEFEPFGPLSFCLDTLQRPDSTMQRGPLRDVAVVTYLTQGEAFVELGSSQTVRLGPRAFSATVPEGMPLTYRTGSEESRFVEIGLAIEPGDVVASNEMRELSVRGRPPSLDCLVSGQGHPDTLAIALDCAIYRAYLRTGENLIFETLITRKLCLLVLRGTIRLEEDRLLPRDTALIDRVDSVPIAAVQAAEVLLIDMA